MMKKKTFLIWITVLAFWAFTDGIAFGQSNRERLTECFENRRWEDIPALFFDDSHSVLTNYFASCKSISIVSDLNEITYKAKFEHQGEIGVVAFDEKDGKFGNLKIKNQIQPLYFIEKFRKFKVDNVKVNIGNAELNFKKGYFYETIPYRSLLLFEGEWEFYIKPEDKEEQLTLMRQYKRDYLKENSKTGIFILTEKSFLKDLPSEGDVVQLTSECQSLYTMYSENFGIKLKQSKEYWYLPFPEGTNLIMFRNDKKSFYHYSYNTNITPDTQFYISDNNSNRLILNYNVEKGMKMSFTSRERVSKLDLGLYVIPDKQMISGSAEISYENPSTLRVVDLAESLKIAANLDQEANNFNRFRKRDKYFLMGSESQKLSLYFNGLIAPNPIDYELFRTKAVKPPQEDQEANKDIFYYYSRNQNFYPNPGSEFFKADVAVTVPGGLNCLSTGNFVDKLVSEATIYKYSSVATKGVSMVIGNFVPVNRLESKIPIQFYISKARTFPQWLNLQEVQNAMDFFLQSYGPLDISTLNVLLHKGEREGGLSNNGFIVVYLPFEPAELPQAELKVTTPTSRMEKRLTSPILLRDKTEDHIIHEMAHQWWGGIVSWSTYQDVWITEGLAHFSVFYYLKKTLSERAFNRIIRKVKGWVEDKSDSGPIIYGNRINLLENSYEAYQSVVYNKSSLVFLMAMELIGEKEFLERLDSVLTKYKYRSITSSQFIKQFCGDNELLLRFFQNWIYSRTLPTVELSLLKDHPEYDKQDLKKIAIRIKQTKTDYIFPLKLEVTTLRGTTLEPVIIKEKENTFVISKDSAIRSITIADSITPVNVEEKR